MCLCFPVCGQLTGHGARGEGPVWKRILRGAEPCRLEAAHGWARALPGHRYPEPTEQGGTMCLLQRQRPGLLSARSSCQGSGQLSCSRVPSSTAVLLMGLGAFRSRLGTFQNWQGHVFSLGPPQLSEAALLRWYTGTLPSSDPSWLWKRRTWEVADVPINAGRSPVSARAAEPESCASTRGNLRGGRSPHTSWLQRAGLGCLPIIRLASSTLGLEPQRGVPQRGVVLLCLHKASH